MNKNNVIVYTLILFSDNNNTLFSFLNIPLNILFINLINMTVNMSHWNNYVHFS